MRYRGKCECQFTFITVFKTLTESKADQEDLHSLPLEEEFFVFELWQFNCDSTQ